MLASRKLLIAGLVTVGVLLVGALIVSLRGGDKYRSACDKFIGYVMKQDSASSYNMLSASAKTADTQESWKTKVISLENVYKQSKLKFISKNTVAQSNGESTQTRTQLKYTVTNPGATSDLTCFVVQDSNKEYKIDGFANTTR